MRSVEECLAILDNAAAMKKDERCTYNSWINCDRRNSCVSCGWRPSVWVRRTNELFGHSENEETYMKGLKFYRLRARMTQSALAERIGVQRARLAMWEIGQSWPPAEILPSLAAALNCSIEQLYYIPEVE